MESFYGGRAGSSFVIVEHYDGISIEYEYNSSAEHIGPCKYQYYAANANDVLYSEEIAGVHELIERTADNYTEYQYLKAIPLDGSTHVPTIDKNSERPYDASVPKVLQKGMVQEFKKGSSTTGVVGYGEYVIIDTFNKNNPDNGKVYRRGMNFSDDLGGAEYIGQIVGPQGGPSEIKIDSYNNFDATCREGTWTPIPGYDPTEQATGREYNDDIEYKYVNIKDDYGLISTFKVGFRIPYLVLEAHANQRSPYYQHDEGGEEGTPLNNNFELLVREDDGTHPFYQNIKISIPHGIHGINADDLKIYPTIALAGCPAYHSVNNEHQFDPSDSFTLITDCNVIERVFGSEGEIGTLDYYELDYLILDNNAGYIDIREEIVPPLEYLQELHLGYRETNYDAHEGGDSRLLDMGPYKIIDHISLESGGRITVSYSCDEPDNLEEILRLIYFSTDDPSVHEETKGIQMEANGSITIYYNKLINESDHTLGRQTQTYPNLMTLLKKFNLGNDGILNFEFNNTKLYDNTDSHLDNTHEKYSFEIPLIVNATLNTNTASSEHCGEFKIVYNNDAVNYSGDPNYDSTTHTYETKIVLPIKAEVLDSPTADSGKVKITYSDGSIETSNRILKWITSVAIVNDQIDPISGPIGDDRFQIQYNDGTSQIVNSGEPINFIEQSAVDHINGDLLVRYTNPKTRIDTGTVTYDNLPNLTNLGHVKGDAGGLRVITHVSDITDLYDEHNIAIKPEDFPIPDYPSGNPEYSGWCMIVDGDDTTVPPTPDKIYYYDYVDNDLYELVDVMSSNNVEPKVIIGTDASYLNNNGVHLNTITRKHV